MSTIAAPALEQKTSVKAGGKWKYLIGGLIILGVVVYATINTAVDYLTLKEVNAQRGALIGRAIRINAPLDKASIQFDDKTLTLKFNLQEGDLIQPVIYKGVVPDTMDKGETVVAEGALGADGVFHASTILVKCPSKYESSPAGSK